MDAQHKHTKQHPRERHAETVPFISFVGKSDSGKTTVLERIISELTRRGFTVATVKNHTHATSVDVAGKDSWRHAQAGARVTMIVSPTEYSCIQRIDERPTSQELARNASKAGADILLGEGNKAGDTHKIEVSRLARSESAVCDPAELVGLITDNPTLARHYEQAGVAVFDLSETSGIAEYLCSHYLKEVDDEQ